MFSLLQLVLHVTASVHVRNIIRKARARIIQGFVILKSETSKEIIDKIANLYNIIEQLQHRHEKGIYARANPRASVLLVGYQFEFIMNQQHLLPLLRDWLSQHDTLILCIGKFGIILECVAAANLDQF